jgi:phosphatidylinositol glycan class B
VTDHHRDLGGADALADARFFRVVLAIALVLHVAAAYFSLGFHQFDEHFQVLEFLSEKLGRTPPQALSVEYVLRERPYVVLAPMYAITRVFEAVVGFSPVWLERLFRLLASLGGLWVYAGLARLLTGEITDRFARRAGVALLLVFWPMVYAHARLSAECIGSTLFWAGWLLAVPARGEGAPGPVSFHPPRLADPGAGSPSRLFDRTVFAGVFFGLAFLLRTQLAAALAGMLLWLLWSRASLRYLSKALAGFLIGAMVGMISDSWGYGAFTVTTWNYFREQYLHGASASFGVDPWFWYLPNSVVALGGPFGVMIVLAVVWFWVRRAAHPIALPSLLVVAGHTAMPHKELRYVLTALPVIAFSVAYALDALARQGQKRPGVRLLRGIAIIYAALSALMIPAWLLRPAALPLYYYTYVDAHFRQGYDVWFDGREPMSMGPFDVYFYRPRVYRSQHASPSELAARLAGPGAFLFFHDALTLPDSPELAAHCRPLVQTVPSWMQDPRVVAAFDPAVLWSLYECRGDTSGS